MIGIGCNLLFGRRSGPPTPSFNPAMVDAWFMSGLSNEDKPDSIKGYKRNLLQLKNFAYALNSGFGEYNVDFLDWLKVSDADKKSISVTIKRNGETSTNEAILYKSFVPNESTSFKVKITGLKEGQALYFGASNEKAINIPNDGVYDIKYTVFLESKGNVGFRFAGVYSNVDITITQLPTAYEGALVFDGVDDYGICYNLPILTDYTVICRRVIEEKDNSTVASKGYTLNNVFYSGAFIVERQSNANNKGVFSFGSQTQVSFSDNEIIYQTKNQYMSTPIKYGDVVDSDKLALGTLNIDGKAFYSCLKGAIYYFALYDKSLTPEEIEEEKVKLNEEWMKRKN